MNIIKKEEATKALVAFTGKSFEFEKINAAIEKLGTAKDLTKEEKQNGVELLEEWNKLTIKRIREKEADLSTLISCLDMSPRMIGFAHKKENLEKFAAICNLSNTFHILEDLEEAILEKEKKRPEPYEFDDDLTKNENLLRNQDRMREQVIFEQELKRMKRHFELELKGFLQKINDNTEIKKAIKAAKEFLRNSEKLENQCRDKAAAAKLNIMISNEELKAALKEMLDFSMNEETF